MSKSDYNKDKRIDINQYLPNRNKTKTLKSINENTVNRYLTKEDFESVIGYVGLEDNRPNTFKITEPTSKFKEKNQLQPVIAETIGSEDFYMSFQDFIRRLESSGVDVENFDTWGSALQFNWVPPINLDKLINYQNYFWDSEDEPEYITIQNYCKFSKSRYLEIKRKIYNNLVSFDIVNHDLDNDIISVDGNQTTNYNENDGILVFSQTTQEYEVAIIEQATFNTTTLQTDLTLKHFSISEDFIPTNGVNLQYNIIDNDEDYFDIQGNLFNLFTEDYPFSISNGTIYQVKDKEAISETVTRVFVEDNTVNINANKLSLLPILSLAFYEKENYCLKEDFILEKTDEINNWNLGSLVWNKHYRILISDEAESSLGGHVFTISGEDFTNLQNNIDVDSKQYKIRIFTGPNKGMYDVIKFENDEVHISEDEKLFARTTNGAEILEYIEVKNQSSPQTNPELNDFWLDPSDDVLYVYDGAQFVELAKNFSILFQFANGSDLQLIQTDDWHESNHWIHRNELTTFTGKTRARIPIIEYNAFLELSDSSNVIYDWKYAKDADTSYISVDDNPSLFELLKIQHKNTSEFILVENNVSGNTEIIFNTKFGNMTETLVEDYEIVFSGFNVNNGSYKVKESRFERTNSGDYRTVVELKSAVPSIGDYPLDSYIVPRYTARGDEYIIDHEHWQFAGIKSIVPSSSVLEVNPLLNEFVDVNPNKNINGFTYQTILGKNYEEFNVTGGPVTAPLLRLNNTLHTLALYEDHQEGDIRVYIDGVRQYGNFVETQSPNSTTQNYVGGIQFSDDVTINNSNRIRVELGEYFSRDVGKRALSLNATYGQDLYNLVENKKIEQFKTKTNQYPYFVIYNVFGEKLDIASNIFKYKVNSDNTIEPNTFLRIERDEINRDFTFEQDLIGEDHQLHCYKNPLQFENAIQSIWKLGNNNEQSVPEKIDGEWDIPNNWYYNAHHENKKEVKLTELFRHFKTIIDSQKTIETTKEAAYYANNMVNYGTGGTIKEHNNGLDVLISNYFVNNSTPIDVIQFAANTYDYIFYYLEDNFIKNVHDTILQDLASAEDIKDDIIDQIINDFSNNAKFDTWFGDGNSFDGGVGIKNFISTMPILGFIEPHKPELYEDGDNIRLLKHDGTRENIAIARATLNTIYKKLIQNGATTQTITSINDLPASPDSGDIVVAKKGTETILYRFSDALVWEEIDIQLMLGQLLLTVETKLYEISVQNNKEYLIDLDSYENNSKYSEYLERRYTKHLQRNRIEDGYINNRFNQNDTFTWNYAYTEISMPPYGTALNLGIASWQALYESIFNTPYPHLEPWKLQGYSDKPTWWDTEYLNTDTMVDRYWIEAMWDNILDGIVPIGYDLPDGDDSTGVSGEVQQYLYVPVNIDLQDTDDGISTDQLIPPFWNSNNSDNDSVRSLFDPDSGDVITTPNAIFEFNQYGFEEWKWRTSSQFNYDQLIVAYQLDPLVVNYFSHGIEFTDVNCLQVDSRTERVYSHNTTPFHGDIINGSTVYNAGGMFEWLTHFNRYTSHDGAAAEYRNLWRDWKNPLSYLFESFIDTDSFDVRNESFDITERDYRVTVKQTKAYDNIRFSGIDLKLMKFPSAHVTNLYSNKNWVVSMFNNKIDGSGTNYYHPQNYDIRYTGNNEFTLFNYQIENVGIQQPRGYAELDYQNNLTLSTSVNFINGQSYQFLINKNNIGNQQITIWADEINTVQDVINEVNKMLNGAYIEFHDGNLRIYSESTAPSSSIEITDQGLFSTVGSFIANNNLTTSLEFLKYFDVSGNVTEYFNTGGIFEVSQSTNFDSEYTIRSVSYLQDSGMTRIFVKEDILIVDDTIDGTIIPDNALTIPWETGQEVYFNTNGVLPSGLLDYIPYYIIKVDDYTFKIANSVEAAENGNSVSISNEGTGNHKIGNVSRTFKPIGGIIDYAWRVHDPDKRQVLSIPNSSVISGIQNIIDVISGYEYYLEDEGVINENETLENIDEETGRGMSWQLEMEKFIVWANNTSKKNDYSPAELTVTPNPATNSFDIVGNIGNIWKQGDRVSISPDDNATLPEEFFNILSSTIPYYVIPNNQSDSFQLAASRRDALNNTAIKFTTTGSGNAVIKSFRKQISRPTYNLNPYKNEVTILHPRGILSNMVKRSNENVFLNSRIYDTNLNNFTNKNLLAIRNDLQTTVSSTNQTDMILGGDLYIDGYEHILNFSNYATDSTLIYDPFFGINTPRFFMEFNRPHTFTLRPTVGGFALLDGSLFRNIESSIDNIRNLYDSYKGSEFDITTEQARKSLGYTGLDRDLLNLGINQKSQFIFWQGFIQAKGTNRSLDAFINQKQFENIDVDEFWAYRLCSFGDSKRKFYPEIKMITDDTVKRELRLEFIPPNTGTVGQNFVPISLTDASRWWNQPEEIRNFAPFDAMFFDTEIIQQIENAEDNIIVAGANRNFIILDDYVDGAVIQAYDTEEEEDVILNEQLDFEFLNSRVINFFSVRLGNLQNIKITTLRYNYEAQQPAKIIDKKNGIVIADIPIWNPAIQEHNPNGYYPIDIESLDDPAEYNETLDDNDSENYWSESMVDTVWFDTYKNHYIPYYDKKIFPDINDRSVKWGRLAPFGDVKLYQWIRTTIPPEEYDETAERQEREQKIPLKDRVTGNTRKLLYKNVAVDIENDDPIWEEDKTLIEPVLAAELNTLTKPEIVPENIPVKIYKNGTYDITVILENDSLFDYFNGNATNVEDPDNPTPQTSTPRRKDYLTLVKEQHEPTPQELNDGLYRYFTPHVVTEEVNTKSNERKNVYYYWVTGLKRVKRFQNKTISLFSAEQAMKNRSEPYMILEGFSYGHNGYGVIYGNTFDPDDVNLPIRYSQCIIKGLKSTVKEDDRFALRFIKDFTLRDRYPVNDDGITDLQLKNKHWEWKLFRRKQLAKIDEPLWLKIVESIVGFEVNSNYEINFDVELPAADRMFFDEIYGGESRYGLKKDQVFVDGETAMSTIIEILNDPNRVFKFVNIIEFLEAADLETPEGIVEFLRNIYEGFDALEVNDIFFEILFDALTNIRQHPDIFKTSWVSIEVGQNINNAPNNAIPEVKTVSNGTCFVKNIEN